MDIAMLYVENRSRGPSRAILIVDPRGCWRGKLNLAWIMVYCVSRVGACPMRHCPFILKGIYGTGYRSTCRVVTCIVVAATYSDECG